MKESVNHVQREFVVDAVMQLACTPARLIDANRQIDGDARVGVFFDEGQHIGCARDFRILQVEHRHLRIVHNADRDARKRVTLRLTRQELDNPSDLLNQPRFVDRSGTHHVNRWSGRVHRAAKCSGMNFGFTRRSNSGRNLLTIVRTSQLFPSASPQIVVPSESPMDPAISTRRSRSRVVPSPRSILVSSLKIQPDPSRQGVH